MSRNRLCILPVAMALLASCSATDPLDDESASSTSSTSPAPAEITFSWTVDPALDEGEEVGVISNGVAASRFRAGRIVVAYDDPADLATILTRYGGTVVGEHVLADYGLAGPTLALVEVDPATADLDGLGASMTSLGVSGSSSFGSEEAASVAAIAAAERAAGRRVGLDWMTALTSIPWSTAEAPIHGYPEWDPDAYQLAYYRRDAVQGIGVGEAWSLMFYAGVLGNRVPIAILDAGFTLDEDLRDPVTHAMDPSYLAFGESHEGWWHGYVTATVAVAIPDNGYGIAGVAGVVAEPILIQLGNSDLYEHTGAILQAYAMGAHIINMSFISAILEEWAYLADVWDEATAAVAEAGVLLFASSGNGGGNVDDLVAARAGLVGTRPCQGPGVICVGGLAHDSIERHPDSTHGNPGGSVDIYAPMCVNTFPPSELGSIFWICGTSIASPFAAGVAALVWAANPALTADEVWDLMAETAHPGRWPRVNAYGAVAAALGSFTNLEFVEPQPLSTHDLSTAVSLAAVFALPSDPAVDSVAVPVRFTSDRDGVIDDHTWTVPIDHDETVTLQRVSTTATGLSEGDHLLTVTATHGGAVFTDTRSITVVNSPPSDPRILRPLPGDEFCAGSTVQMRGDAFDVNQQLGLPESAFGWHSSRDGSLGTGRNLSVSTLSAGIHEITLSVEDQGGLRATESVLITVLATSHANCTDAPPNVWIAEPDDGYSFYVDGLTHETGVDDAGAYVVIVLRLAGSDDHQALDDLQIDFYVRPDEPDSYVGSGVEVQTRLHLPDGKCSLAKSITVVVFDGGGNRVEDQIEVFVNRFC